MQTFKIDSEETRLLRGLVAEILINRTKPNEQGFVESTIYHLSEDDIKTLAKVYYTMLNYDNIEITFK